MKVSNGTMVSLGPSSVDKVFAVQAQMSINPSINMKKSSVVAYEYNPSTGEGETGSLELSSHTSWPTL